VQDLNDSEVEQELSGLTNADDVPGTVGSVSLNYLPL
jgi:UDP-N-acetylenolpyruvoylglucosamine reductase